MSSTRNILVKLRDPDTKLRCMATDWEITRDEVKRTPENYSKRIHGWVGSGALVRVDSDDAASNAEISLLDTGHKSMNRDGLVTFINQINEADPDAELKHDGLKVPDLKDVIQGWKDAQAAGGGEDQDEDEE